MWHKKNLYCSLSWLVWAFCINYFFPSCSVAGYADFPLDLAKILGKRKTVFQIILIEIFLKKKLYYQYFSSVALIKKVLVF
jgi:hypothetical protein